MAETVGPNVSPDTFHANFPDARRLCIAYSGGRDSHALLALAVARFRDTEIAVDAVHVNHQLHPDSARWADHCETVCQAFGIALEVVTVSVSDRAGDGPEAAARTSRYRAFESTLSQGAVLAQAHHADDQAETLLMRLMRGAGVHGMTGMPVTRRLGAGWLWRPLLDVSADALTRFAHESDLQWIDDPSNADTRFDRNFVRQTVMPLLRARWPQAVRAAGDTARHLADAASVLDGHLDERLAQTDSQDLLACAVLRESSRPEALLLLHRWCRRVLGHAPSRDQLERGLDEVVNAHAEAHPCLKIGEFTLRRHRDQLYLIPLERPFDPEHVIEWPVPHGPLHLPDGTLLTSESVMADGLAPQHLSAHWQIRFRQGGESIKLSGRPRAPLKKVLHAFGVPPWERASKPLLYIDGELAWVCGVGLDTRFRG